MAAPKWEVIEGDAESPPNPAPAAVDHSLAIQMLTMGLKALSARAVIAFSALFTLITVGSAFWLCLSIPDPSTPQLVEIGGYFLFVLAANYLVKRQ